MIIRKARTKDIKAIAKLEYELNLMHYKFDKYYSMIKNPLKSFEAFNKKRIYDANSVVFVAEIDGKVVGFIAVGISKRPPIFIERRIGSIGATFIEKKYRRLGIGKKLVNEACSWLKSKGMKHAELTVHEKNPEGLGAWSKFGFKRRTQERIKKL